MTGKRCPVDVAEIQLIPKRFSANRTVFHKWLLPALGRGGLSNGSILALDIRSFKQSSDCRRRGVE